MHGCYSHIQNKSLPAHPGCNFISHFPAITDSFHSCIYIQIFFPSDLKLQSSSGLRKQGPSSAQCRGCNFIPGMGLLHLNPAFVLGAPTGTSPRSLNHPLVFGYRQHSAPSSSLQIHISEGRKGRTGLEQDPPRAAPVSFSPPTSTLAVVAPFKPAISICQGDSL